MANPNKTPAIVTILVSNRDKLLKYLGDFHTDKGAPALVGRDDVHFPKKLIYLATSGMYMCISSR